MSVHKGVRYQCQQCEKTFALKSNLKTHITSIHDGLKYSCNQCEAKFTQKGNLKAHIMSVHKNRLKIEDNGPSLFY